MWPLGDAHLEDEQTMIGGRYRAMLNFLERPRIVIKLKKKRGPIRDVAFSTERPNEILYIVKQVFAGQHTDGDKVLES